MILFAVDPRATRAMASDRPIPASLLDVNPSETSEVAFAVIRRAGLARNRLANPSESDFERGAP